LNVFFSLVIFAFINNFIFVFILNNNYNSNVAMAEYPLFNSPFCSCDRLCKYLAFIAFRLDYNSTYCCFWCNCCFSVTQVSF